MSAQEQYGVHMDWTDLVVALECEAQRAMDEGMVRTAERQGEKALHIRNAERHLRPIVPFGFRLQTRLVFEFVADVNHHLKLDIPPRTARQDSSS